MAQYPELSHQIAAVNMPVPEQAELYELETLLNSPAQIRLVVGHDFLPKTTERIETMRTQLLGLR